MATKQIHLFISGRVQGVFFRAEAQGEARRLGLTGWVRNLPDGRVEVVAQGPKEKLEKFIEWCRHGPPGAHVAHLEQNWDEGLQEFQDFQITD